MYSDQQKFTVPSVLLLLGEDGIILAATAPHSCKPTIPDRGGGHDGAAEDRGNRYMLVFQDFLTKWPLAGRRESSDICILSWC